MAAGRGGGTEGAAGGRAARRGAGGGGGADGGAEGPLVLRSPPAGARASQRAGRCERQPRRAGLGGWLRHGGRVPRLGTGARRAAAERLPRRWEPRARAGAEPRGAAGPGLTRAAKGKTSAPAAASAGAAEGSAVPGVAAAARGLPWHRPSPPLRDAPPAAKKSPLFAVRGYPGLGEGPTGSSTPPSPQTGLF